MRKLRHDSDRWPALDELPLHRATTHRLSITPGHSPGGKYRRTTHTYRPAPHGRLHSWDHARWPAENVFVRPSEPDSYADTTRVVPSDREDRLPHRLCRGCGAV